MRVYHDWEFLERGPEFPIVPISVGMVREDGETLYYVFQEAPWDDISQNDWLMENVMPQLGGHLNYKSTNYIRTAIMDFLYVPEGATKHDLWGWYSAYDHVCLAQLFGRMIDIPSFMNMWTNDIRQEAYRYNILIPKSKLWDVGETEHNALHDALIQKRMHEWLINALRAKEAIKNA